MYLQNCLRLTTSAAFARVANHINECYYTLDWKNYELMLADQDFFISIDRWNSKLNDKTKHYCFSGRRINFREFALYKIKEVIDTDVETFTSHYLSLPLPKQKEASNEFVTRVKQIKRLIKRQNWLTDLFEEIEPVFDHIIDTYSNSLPNSSGGGQELLWNGQINQLTTLLLRLTDKRVDNKKERLLSATSQQLVDFVYNNFVDQNSERFSPATLKTLLDPTRVDKRVIPKKELPLEELLGEK